MKLTKSFFLISLLASLVLCGCGDTGFGVVRKPHDHIEDDKSSDNMNNDTTDYVGGNGGAGNNEDKNNEAEPQNPNPTTDTINEDNQSTVIDMTGRITMFKFNFVEIVDNSYIYATFDSDPLAEQYHYAYYKVNGDKIENQLLEKAELKEENVYKINLNTVNPGRYTVEFYNNEDTQYGLAYINIAGPSPTTTMISVAFGVIQIQIATIGYNIMLGFQKIGDWFTNLFTRDSTGSVSM